tara:strand:- start:5310 stop:6155 length:846 start_codon:yes stop_codon:yes gene_type:complete
MKIPEDSISPFEQQSIARSNTTLGRYYHLYGTTPVKVPSVTTVISNVINKGYAFDMWLKNYGHFSDWYRNFKANKGTAVHYCIEKLKNGETLSFGEIKEIVFRYCNVIDVAMNGGKSALLRSVCMYLESYMAYYEEHKPLLLACEYQMYSQGLGFAGTADEICEIGTLAQRTILDIKTGSQSDNHIIQGNAYAMLWNELNPDYKVGHVAVLYLKDSFKLKPTFTLKMEPVDTTMWEDILKIYQNKYMNKDGGYKQKAKWSPRVQFNIRKEIADVRMDTVEI